MSRFSFRRWTFSVGRSTFGFLRFMERPQINFDAHGNHERAGSGYFAPPELVNNKHHRRGEVLRAWFMGSLHVIKHHPWAFDVRCWMFTWALNVEGRMLTNIQRSTFNAQRPRQSSTPGP